MKIKVLIIRFSSIGDIVLTTPVVRCIAQQLNQGDVEVHFLTKKSFSFILENNPYVQKVYSIDKKVNEVADGLENEHYDYVFDLHKNLRSSQAKKATKALSFTFKKYNLHKWWYVNTKKNVMPDVHIVDRYFETTKAFKIKNDREGLDYFIPEKDEVKLKEVPSFLHSGFISYGIGGQHQGKILPTNKIIQLLEKIPHPVALIGGKEDEARGDEIAQSGPDIWNACGAFNLNQSASIVKQSKVLIAHDTGIMHIGAALKKPVLSLWGATVPEFGMYPYLPREGSEIFEPQGVKNRPYSKLGNKQWYKKEFTGMDQIDVQVIAEKAKALFEKSPLLK